MKLESLCLHAGYSPENGQPRVLPIAQSTTFKYDSTAEVAKLFDLAEAGFFYTRLGNPTVDAVEQKNRRSGGRSGRFVHLVGPGRQHACRAEPGAERRARGQCLQHLRGHLQPLCGDPEEAGH